MKEIPRITIGLTISCLAAGLIMGFVFSFTAGAKKHNEHMNVQQTMLGLLGYGRNNPAPRDLELSPIYRYIIEDGRRLFSSYMIPVRKDGSGKTYELVILTMNGEFVGQKPLALSASSAEEPADRQKALRAALGSSETFIYGDSAIVATRSGKVMAYLLPGQFPGFKTIIKVMLALDPSFNIIGLDIMEQEEDPGLGAEIAKNFFKNQFKCKPLEKVKQLGVIKEPLPEEYSRALEDKKSGLTAEQVHEILCKYKDNDIYAITGATISSRSVAEGVKNMVRRFVYRIETLDSVVAKQGIPAAF